MRNFFLRLIVNAIALFLTAYILPGITVSTDILTLLLIALVFGVVNAFVKPLVIILTLPATILTLGLFLFVINGLMLWLTSAIVGSAFVVDGLLWAVIGGVVFGVIGMIIEGVFNALGIGEKPRRRHE